MVITVDEKLKKKLMKNGSHLKFTRSYGGAGAGIMAMGLMLGGIGILLGAMFMMSDMTQGGIVILGGGIAVCVVLTLIGVLMKNRRSASYLKYYNKKSGYAEDVLKTFDEEFRNGNSILFSPCRTVNGRGRKDGAIMTDHWLKMPYMLPIQYSGLYRIVDIAAIWYEEQPYVEGIMMGPTLFTVNSEGDGIFCRAKDQNFGYSIVEEVAKRNPKTITARSISVNGQTYDCALQPEEVAALYRKAYLVAFV